MTKQNDYFLSLNGKSKQRYNVKINNMQGYDPYQITQEELSGDISKFPTQQQAGWCNLVSVECL